MKLQPVLGSPVQSTRPELGRVSWLRTHIGFLDFFPLWSRGSFEPSSLSMAWSTIDGRSLNLLTNLLPVCQLVVS